MLSVELNLNLIVYTTVCLNHIMDIQPSFCGKIATCGGVALLCKKLQNVDSFDLIDHVIRALDKMSAEIPQAILAGNGLLFLSQLIDFFDYRQQVILVIYIWL